MRSSFWKDFRLFCHSERTSMVSFYYSYAYTPHSRVKNWRFISKILKFFNNYSKFSKKWAEFLETSKNCQQSPKKTQKISTIFKNSQFFFCEEFLVSRFAKWSRLWYFGSHFTISHFLRFSCFFFCISNISSRATLYKRVQASFSQLCTPSPIGWFGLLPAVLVRGYDYTCYSSYGHLSNICPVVSPNLRVCCSNRKQSLCCE